MNQKNKTIASVGAGPVPAQDKGITLIALVVTIIVLLILAGVTINMVLGNDGIIGQAQKAKEDTNKVQKDMEKDLASLPLEVNFKISQTGKERKARSGMVTNIDPGETRDNLKADLPEGYKIYRGETEIADNVPLATGMIIKNGANTEKSKVIIYGDVDR